MRRDVDDEMDDEMDTQFLHICGTCFRLYETGREDEEDDQEQRCDCNPQEDEEGWAGRDFNERASLCKCCGSAVLESGSRYSQYFCGVCKLLAMGVSLWERRLVFPVGPHSIMHTWVPETRKPSLAAHGGDARRLARTVHKAITAISRGSDGLSEWSAIVVSRHLKRLGLPGGTSVDRYLGAIASDNEGPTQWALFAEMCEFMRIPSQES
jgi:hypothetical protein